MEANSMRNIQNICIIKCSKALKAMIISNFIMSFTFDSLGRLAVSPSRCLEGSRPCAWHLTLCSNLEDSVAER